MNSFQIIILSFFMSITVMSVSAQNNDSIKINNFSIEKNAQGDSVSLRFHLMIAPGITKANDELLLTPILIDIKGNHSFAFPVIRVNGKIREKIVRRQKSASLIKSRERLNIYSIQSAMEYNNMFNSDVGQSTLDMAGKVSVMAATWKLLYEKGVGYGGIVYVEPDGWIFYC